MICDEGIDLYAEQDIQIEQNLFNFNDVKKAVGEKTKDPQEGVSDNGFILNSRLSSPQKVKVQGSVLQDTGPNDALLNPNKGMHKLYVGGLPWWTTGEHISSFITEMGVDDLVEVKLFENRANGQSKGYGQVTLNSEFSYEFILEELPKKTIDGEHPCVTPCTNAAFQMFESQSKTRNPKYNSSTENYEKMENRFAFEVPPPQMAPYPPQVMEMRMNIMRGPRGPPSVPFVPFNNGRTFCNAPQQFGFNGPPLRPQRPPQYFPSAPSFPQNTFQSFRPRFEQEMGRRCPPPPQIKPYEQKWSPPPPPPGVDQHGLPLSAPIPFPPPPQSKQNQPSFNGFYTEETLMRGDKFHASGTKDFPVVSRIRGTPAPHVNPSFVEKYCNKDKEPPRSTFSRSSTPFVFQNESDRRQRHQEKRTRFSASVKNEGSRGEVLSETEVLKALSCNMSVSNSAINRAMNDVCKGDFGSAVETLVTAMSVLKRSKVAKDKRCEVLITSLEDALTGVEKTSYGRVRDLRFRDSKKEDRISRRQRRADSIDLYFEEMSKDDTRKSRSRSPARDSYRRSRSPDERFDREISRRDREHRHHRSHY